MKQLILQLHITGKCNLQCKHCYISEHSCEMSFVDIKNTLQQFDCWGKTIQQLYNDKVTLHLHITGGEPLLHSEIRKIIRYLSRKNKKYKIAFMTNGTLLDRKVLKRMKRLRMKPMQLSLDGTKETHDKIRGNGNFDKVISAMELLYDLKVPCRVSFTANKDNYLEFSKVAEICRKHHVSSLWSDRYIPPKHGELTSIGSEDMENYISILRKEAENIENQNAGLRVENFRALQFLGTNDQPYHCKAGETFLAVDEHGDIMPCRRLPIICGNIKNTTLSKVYFEHSTFINLRKHETSEKCHHCKHIEECRGGARCMTYAVHGEYTGTDPGCYLNELVNL